MYSLHLLQERHSVRSYQDTPLTERQTDALRAIVSEINSYLPGTRFQMFLNDDTPFRGKMGSYGVFRGARNFLAAVIDTGIANIDRIAGFAAEHFVLEATAQGLGSCFIGGTFAPEKINAQMRAGETIRFIVAFGVPAQKERAMAKLMASFAHRKSMTPENFFDADRSKLTLRQASAAFPKFPELLKAVACAPSALNARPVRVWIDDDTNICLGTVKDGGFTQVDLGIAEFNASCIIPGEFDRLPDRSILLPY